MINVSCFILSFRPLPPPARSLCGEIRKSVGLWGCDSFPEPAFTALDVSDSSRLVQVYLRSASSPSCTFDGVHVHFPYVFHCH